MNGHRLRAGPVGKIVETSLEQGRAAERKLVVEILSAQGSAEPEGMSFSNLHTHASYLVFLLSTSWVRAEAEQQHSKTLVAGETEGVGTTVDEDTV